MFVSEHSPRSLVNWVEDKWTFVSIDLETVPFVCVKKYEHSILRWSLFEFSWFNAIKLFRVRMNRLGFVRQYFPFQSLSCTAIERFRCCRRMPMMINDLMHFRWSIVSSDWSNDSNQFYTGGWVRAYATIISICSCSSTALLDIDLGTHSNQTSKINCLDIDQKQSIEQSRFRSFVRSFVHIVDVTLR
jgi:hypothetical protein